MKSSSKDRVCIWYLEPKTQNTNHQIASLLGADVSASEQGQVKCKDGKSHNIWEVQFSLVQKLFHSSHLGYFKVFRSVDGGLPADITKIVANFFRPKIKKTSRLKKASEIL